MEIGLNRSVIHTSGAKRRDSRCVPIVATRQCTSDDSCNRVPTAGAVTSCIQRLSLVSATGRFLIWSRVKENAAVQSNRDWTLIFFAEFYYFNPREKILQITSLQYEQKLTFNRTCARKTKRGSTRKTMYRESKQSSRLARKYTDEKKKTVSQKKKETNREKRKRERKDINRNRQTDKKMNFFLNRQWDRLKRKEKK